MKKGLFPLPLYAPDCELDGLAVARHSECESCGTNSCLDGPASDDFRVCENGLAYRRLSTEIVTRGLLLDDWDPAASVPRPLRRLFKKLRRDAESSQRIKLKEALRWIQLLREAGDVSMEVVAGANATDEQVSTIAEEVRKQLGRTSNVITSGMIHDQLQLLSTIYQNIDFIMNERYQSSDPYGREFPPIRPLDSGRSKALWQKEKAIAVTCELMAERQRAARLMMDGSSVPSIADLEPKNPHQLVTKAVHLYRSNAEAKNVEFRIGAWWEPVMVYPDLAMIPIIGIVDNAVKYAPRASRIDIDFEKEPGSAVRLRFRSLGPRIQADEREKIFRPGYRGQNAERSGAHGTGIGLYQARLSVRGWAAIYVEQATHPAPGHSGCFETSFYLAIAREHEE